MSNSRSGLAKHSVVGVFWTGLSMGFLAVAQLVALLVLARLLSPSEFGLYSAALIIIRFSTIFQGLGIAPAIVQRPVLEERHLRVGFTFSLLLGLAVSALVWVMAPLFADLLRLADLALVVRAICVIFLFQGLSMVAQASAQRALRFRWLALVDACAFALGYVVVGPILAWLGFGIWTLVGALLTQQFISTIMLLTGQPHPMRPLLERRAIVELLYFGGGFTVARVCNYLATQADRLVVGRWLGADALGLYGLSSQLMTTPAVIVGQVFDRVLFPTMALVQEEPVRLARAYRSAVAGCALLVLPASVVVSIVAPELVLVILGRNWEGVVAPLQILAFGMLFRTSYKLSDSISRATGTVYARAWRQAVFTIGVFVGSVIGQRWGVEGVAFGVGVAFAVNFFLMAQLSLRVTRMTWSEFAAAHLPGVALAGVVGTGAWAVVEWMRELRLPPLPLLIDVALLASAGSLLLCWVLPSLFLGREGLSLLRLVVSVAPAWPQFRRQG
ncbi:lipopolysaccharide biosynthesis protein [Mesorhizobium australafricanum]|uniref:Lipopolysaccharide biosynthesis protein n=1 Tax=Mesorhizobium australafricanum TaxID=3072311 RepID=A0ABU4X1J9_9HYPH|nr:lipopolysaccharide biosynthesis protein [Mesorhizobium sp. VK3E]MDX8442184.1 lipopolysaccharide biosynthesis protein [Mesorhizobium sp. VK3E]